jgi:transposase
MKTPTRFITKLTAEEQSELQAIMKSSPEQVRCRAHAILLSARNYSIDQIADIYEVDRDTVSLWLRAWEEDGSAGLGDQKGRGRKPLLNEKEQREAVQIVEQEPRSTKHHLHQIEKKTGKKISAETLKKILKKSGKVWKRMRQGLFGKRDEADFRAAQTDVEGLREQAMTGEITLYYYDEAGFSLTPCVPYAWQDKGTTLTLPTSRSTPFNVAGFFDVVAQQLHSFVTPTAIDTEFVIACFDHLSQSLTQPTVVILDQAPTHTSRNFQARIPAWEEQGLFIYPLSAYSPELNLIEILWRKIKYEWLPLSAYESCQTLYRALKKVLVEVGSKYQINFA